MKLIEIKRILDAELFSGTDILLDQDVTTVFAADMMSDVLAFGNKHTVLITSLCNPQIVRTSEMLDIGCIIQVNGKTPDQSIYELATEREIVVLCTKHTTFTTCGLLYECGIRGN